MTNEPQDKCEGGFLEILPLRFGAQREYTRSDLRRVPGSAYPAAGHFFLPGSGAQCVSPQPLPLTLRVLEAIPPRPDDTMPAEETVAPHTRLKRTGSNPVEGNRHTTVIDWASGSGSVAKRGARRKPDTLTDGKQQTHLKPRNGRGVAASRSPLSFRPAISQPELALSERKRLCERCRTNEVYLDIKTMDLCEPCLWAIIEDDQHPKISDPSREGEKYNP